MISGIHVSPSEIVINRGNEKKETLPLLVKDGIVHAKVLNLLPQGNARLLINGQTVLAKTAMLLKPGEELQLKVLDQKDAVVLKLVGPVQKITPQQILSLVRFFPGNEPVPDINDIKIPRVRTLLHDMALKSAQTDQLFLPRLIEKSGMTWEHKMAKLLLTPPSAKDLKQDLSILLNQDVKGLIHKELHMTPPNLQDGFKMAASFSETLENFQLLNFQGSDSGRYLLPFPVFSGDLFRFGQLFINTGGKSENNGSDGDKLVQISFLLDMTRLGPLRADFSILKKEITGRFLLTDEQTCEYVRSMIPELEQRLAKAQYKVRQIDCLVGDRIQIQDTGFIEALINADDSQVVNIVI